MKRSDGQISKVSLLEMLLSSCSSVSLVFASIIGLVSSQLGGDNVFRLRLEQTSGRFWGEFREVFRKVLSEFWKGSWARFGKILEKNPEGSGGVSYRIGCKVHASSGKFLPAPFLLAYCSCCWGYGQSFFLK